MNINNSLDYPDFPPDYIPETVEIYDHLALLVKIKRGQIIQENYRPVDFKPQLICWFFDGIKAINLAYAHTDKIVLVNRIARLQVKEDINSILKSGE